MENRKQEQPEKKSCFSLPKTKLLLFRSFVICSLIATTCICGIFSYLFLSQAEEDTYNTQYESVTSQLRDTLQDRLMGAEYAANELAGLLSISYPDASQWPYTYIEGYDEIYKPIAAAGRLDGAATSPLVTSDQAVAFIRYVNQSYKNDEYTAQVARDRRFDYGIFSIDDDLNVYQDLTGVTPHSEYDFITPFLNVGDIETNYENVLYNIHSSELGAAAIDASYECGLQFSLPCAVMSAIIIDFFPEPTTLLTRAVYPLHDQDTLVGFQSITLSWNKMLTGLVPDYVCGIDVVLKTSSLGFTYSICDGIAMLKCSGDCSDSKFQSDRIGFLLVLESAEAFQPTPYSIELYPNQDFYDIYHSDTPWIAAVSAVVIIFFTSLVFILYDFMVKQESQARAQVLEAKRRFVRFVSHEIRTPLNTLILGLKILIDTVLKMGLEEKHEKVLIDLTKELQGSSDVAVLILNDLLQYDKIETGNLKLEVSDVSIWGLISQNVHLFEGPAAEKRVDLRESLLLPDSDPEIKILGVHGDPLRISQVIGNLISNALKFSPAGSTITIRSSYEKESKMPESLVSNKGATKHILRVNKVNDWMLFSVEDKGPGISQENLNFLFGEGVQFNPNKLQSGQGSGLGLWISKGIIELHGGNIWASSEGEGLGCTFNFELPLVKIAAVDCKDDEEINVKFSTEDMETDSNEKNDFVEVENYTPCILVVDDVPMCRRMLGRSLQMKGYEYKEAEDGKICVDMVKSGEVFDCILMDFQMPLMNGPDATRELIKLGCHTPVIGVTGNVLSEDVKEFMDAGAVLVMQKPFQMEIFEEFMKNNFKF